jgi:hypothetical protein
VPAGSSSSSVPSGCSGETTVSQRLAKTGSGRLLEPENLGVELERLALVIHQDAYEM